MARVYQKLETNSNYDPEQLEEFVEMLGEYKELQQRKAILDDLIAENSHLKPYVWQTAKGDILPFHKIEDDHFANILQHVINRAGSISKELRGEARRRGLSLPLGVSESSYNRAELEYEVGYHDIEY